MIFMWSERVSNINVEMLGRAGNGLAWYPRVGQCIKTHSVKSQRYERPSMLWYGIG